MCEALLGKSMHAQQIVSEYSKSLNNVFTSVGKKKKENENHNNENWVNPISGNLQFCKTSILSYCFSIKLLRNIALMKNK